MCICVCTFVCVHPHGVGGVSGISERYADFTGTAGIVFVCVYSQHELMCKLCTNNVIGEHDFVDTCAGICVCVCLGVSVVFQSFSAVQPEKHWWAAGT